MRVKRRRISAGLSVVIVATVGLFLSLWAPGAARAAGSCDSWTNPNGGLWTNPANWSGGVVPGFDGPADNVCITLAGTYTITFAPFVTPGPGGHAGGALEIASLTLGASSGTQTLDIAGQSYVTSMNETSRYIDLQVDGADTIGAHGVVNLDSGDTGSSAGDGNGGDANFDAGTLANAGTIDASVEDSANLGLRSYLGGTITNTGTIAVNSGKLQMPTQNFGGNGHQNNENVTNSGTINVAQGAEIDLSQPGTGANPSSFTQNGTITNNGQIYAQGDGGQLTWIQQGGAITGNPVHMQNGVVLQDSGGSGAFLYDYNGGGISGTVPAGQTVTFLGNSYITSMNETSSNDAFDLEGKTLTNHGTIVVESSTGGAAAGGPTGATAELMDGGIDNYGTINLPVDNPSLGYIDDLEIGLTNHPGASIVLASGQSQFAGGATVVNDGTITIAPTASLHLLSCGFCGQSPEAFSNAADGTIVPQVANATSYGTVIFANNSKNTLGGTVAPALVGGYAPAAGTELQAFQSQGGSFSGTFATVGGGFSADYSNPSSVGLIYKPSPAGSGTGSGSSSGSGSTSGKGSTSGGGTQAGATPKVASVSSSANTVRVVLACTAKTACARTQVSVTVKETLRHGKVIAVALTGARKTKTTTRQLVVARGSVQLAAGKRATLTLTLNRAGAKLLAQHHHLAATITVSTGTRTLKRSTVRLSAPRAVKRKRK